jgi:cytochrome b561
MAKPTGYSTIQITLHWLVLLLVVVQLLVAESMTETVDAIEEGGAVSATTAFFGSVHFWVGLAILAVMLTRLGVRLRRGAPEHADTSNAALTIVAKTVHYALYAALIAAPISGLLAYYGIADIGDIHALVRPALFILVGLHILGALYGQFVRKDSTLTRMTKPAT